MNSAVISKLTQHKVNKIEEYGCYTLKYKKILR